MAPSTVSDAASTAATETQLLERSKDVWWYQKDVPTLSQPVRGIFEKYSNIPPQRVDEHVFELREKAWEIHPFPCIGRWRFLDLVLCHQPQYDEILSRIQQGDKFLDLGCCFGQEIRRLILDGAPPQNLVGVDLRQDYLDLGHELFRDRDTDQSTYVAANALDPTAPEWERLADEFSIVYTGAFFHCFDRPQQVSLAKLVTRLLRPIAGSMLLGRQVGDLNPGAYEHKTNEGGIMFRHNEQSWRELWDEVGQEMGVQWKVEVELREVSMGTKTFERSTRELYYCIRRL